MGFPSSLAVSTVVVALTALQPGIAAAQPTRSSAPPRVTQMASLASGSIAGVVLDEAGHPLDGVVVSALGGGTGFAVTDVTGRFTLASLPPGPYLVRAHLSGYMPARNTMVDVRPSVRTASSFTMRRVGTAAGPRVAAAGFVGLDDLDAVGVLGDGERDDSETAWRLRHLKRSVLKDTGPAGALLGDPDEDGNFLGDSFGRLGRAVGESARLASMLLADVPFQGEVNLLTTGAFDAPGQIFDMARARQVTFLALGAPVGEHGDWTARMALNQGDLDSWILAGQYAVRAPAAHRFTFGMSYGLQRYGSGNALALVTAPEEARNVGAVYAFDEWRISRTLTIGYGGAYAHYDYLAEPSLFSPRLSATVSVTPRVRVRAVASRQLSAPGAEEFLPPTRTQWLPPQRTFAPLSKAGYRTEGVEHYELGLERTFDGATIGIRAFTQHVDDQAVTLFDIGAAGLPAADLRHYFVGTAGDANIRGWGVNVSQALTAHIRGTVAYTQTVADWDETAPSADLALLTAVSPSTIREGRERLHDLTTSVEGEIPQTDTRVFVLYRFNSAFVRGDLDQQDPGFGYRFDVQVSQGLPFMNFLSAEWEMLVAVRNVFREALAESSIYDEIFVVRPPKRVVGGLTVRF